MMAFYKPQPIYPTWNWVTWFATVLLSTTLWMGCGDNDDLPATAAPTPTATAVGPSPTPTIEPPPAPSPAGGTIFSYGNSTLEMRVLSASAIVRARLVSISTNTERTVIGNEVEASYFAILELKFNVLEYLKGSGGTEVIGMVATISAWDTESEAKAELPKLLAAHDTRWDDRDAIIFLNRFEELFPSSGQSNRYVMGRLTYDDDSWGSGDLYSVASEHDKRWLPAALPPQSAASAQGDTQAFLLDAPQESAAGTSAAAPAPTITLGALKTKIAELEAEITRGGGSDEYRLCVRRRYEWERDLAYRPRKYYRLDATVTAGLTVNSLVYDFGEYSLGFQIARDKNKLTQFWLEGQDKDLFKVIVDNVRDWENSGYAYDVKIETARPLPGGQYKFFFEHRLHLFNICDAYPDGTKNKREWFVNVTAPTGTLHEAFFDPVTVGSAIAADATNGVLKPTAFTDGNNASATLQRIAWESGTVKLKLSPHTGLANHVLDFIVLDGKVSLSLDADEATVDAANNTLSWPVSHQPWKDGDKLMLRIREARE